MRPIELRTMRKKAKLTQKQAAEMVHVHERTFRKWELGEQPVPKMAAELFAIKTRAKDGNQAE